MMQCDMLRETIRRKKALKQFANITEPPFYDFR